MSDNNYPFKGPDCNAHPLKEDQPSDVAVCQLHHVNQSGHHGYGYNAGCEKARVCVTQGERESSWISDGGVRIEGWRDRMQQRRERQMGWWGESETERDSLGAESLERKMIGSQEMGGIQSVCVCGEKEWTQAWVHK